jgi:hypothetical protein
MFHYFDKWTVNKLKTKGHLCFDSGPSAKQMHAKKSKSLKLRKNLKSDAFKTMKIAL